MASLHDGWARRAGLLGYSLLAYGILGCGGEGGRSRGETASAAALPTAAEASAAETGAGMAADGELLLDDLTDGDARFAAAGISGEWFTYSDGTSMVTPADHTGLVVTDGEAHVFGQRFSDWGVGLSAYLRSADLSAFCQLKLTLRGSGAIVVELATPATSPASEGGTCVGSGCFGHFAKTIQLEPTYQEFEIAFAELAQPSWAQPTQLSLAGVISFNLVTKAAPGAPVDIDLWVDRLALQACP
jgi:hypothetical protein